MRTLDVTDEVPATEEASAPEAKAEEAAPETKAN